MAFGMFGGKSDQECQLHGASSRSGGRMLLFMLLASFSLIVWHVWTYGPSNRGVDQTSTSLIPLVGSEISDLLFNKRGIMVELWEVFPYFIAGILIAGYLRTYKLAVKLQASLRKYGVLSVVVASFVGIITPLCACGTLTTAISLLFAGLPLAPVMSLMVTSPLLSPSTYLLTLNDLGPEWTVIRTVSALSMGIFAGLVTHFLAKRGFGRNDIFIEGGIIRGDFHDEDYPDERLRCGCRQNFGNRVAVRTGNNFLIFLAKSSEMIWTVGKYIIVGVTVGAVVERYMPKEWIYHFFGEKSPLSIVWITLASVPMFVHQISASSIMFHIKNSLGGTLDNGAALAFMIGGPVTAVPTMVLFWTFFKKRVFALYMFVCLAGTICIAYTFQLLVFVPGVDLGNPLLKGVSALSGGSSVAIVKKGKDVRMVMDPGGKGIIATSADDSGSRGGMVFDTSADRFTGKAGIPADNSRYVANVAEWLEQNLNSPPKNSILVYNLAAGSVKNGSGLDKTIVDDLKSRGFKLKVTDRGETPILVERDAAEYSQLWLISDNDGTSRLKEEEVKLLTGWSESGKSLLIVPPQHPFPTDELYMINRLVSGFGVVFEGVVENPPQLPVSVANNLFARGSELIGSMLKMVKKA